MPRDSLGNLKELARIVNAAMPKRRLVLSREDIHDDKNMYGQFFNALVSGDYDSEEMLAKGLLHTTVDSDKYRMTKSRLKVILLNTLFHLDLRSAGRSKWSQTQQTVRHALLQGRTALSWDARELAKSIAIKALEEALQYELWYDAMGLATLLVSIEGLEGNPRGHAKYWDEYERLRALEFADELARKRMEELIIPFAKSGSEKPALAARARRYMLETGRAFEQHQTFGLALSYWRIRCGYSQIRMDYRSPLAACDELDKLLKDQFARFDAPYLRAEIEKKRVVCLYQLGEYAEADRFLRAAERWEENGSTNWFVLREYAFVICMHRLRFADARSVLRDVTLHKRFNRLPDHRRERWKIFAQFLDYCEGRPTARDMKGLLDKLPEHTKDHDGFKAAALLIETLELLTAAQPDTPYLDLISSRMEALKKYEQRHLTGATGKQFKTFLRLLRIYERSGFDPARSEIRGHNTLELLGRMKPDDVPGFRIVPLDWLWKQLLARSSAT